ncbi:MAG: hypothetical protein ACYTGV_02610 [Planctomycetota bacterium]|jgi:hypothetical protein
MLPAILALLCAAPPIDSEKLELLPGLLPKQRRAIARRAIPRIHKGEDVSALLLEQGIDPAVVAALARVRPGPLLVERYAKSLIRALPDLAPAQRRLFGQLVPAVAGAQRAIWDPKDERVAGRRVQLIEKRFWRVASFALTSSQRARLRKLHPPRYAEVADLLGHIYLLPGLTPSQANRVQALATEFASETAADQAELQRLKAMTISPPERLHAIEDRIADRLRSAFERGRLIFTPAQQEILDALPPLLTAADRTRPASEILDGISIGSDQRKQLERLGRAIAKRAEEAREKARSLRASLEGEIGPDSPQAMTMRMIGMGAESATVTAMEEAAHEAVLQILEPEQLRDWIVSAR